MTVLQVCHKGLKAVPLRDQETVRLLQNQLGYRQIIVGFRETSLYSPGYVSIAAATPAIGPNEGFCLVPYVLCLASNRRQPKGRGNTPRFVGIV